MCMRYSTLLSHLALAVALALLVVLFNLQGFFLVVVFALLLLFSRLFTIFLRSHALHTADIHRLDHRSH